MGDFSGFTLDHLARAFPSLPSARAAELLDPLNAALKESEADSPLRAAMWLGQWGVETRGLTRFEENLHYSPLGLHEMWPKHFTPDEAIDYAHRGPEAIANRAYANRMGNGDEASGDGWRFRGRGLGMVTGHDNYASFGASIGEPDIVQRPDDLATPRYAFRAGSWFWRTHRLNEAADDEDIERATRIVTGGATLLEEREKLYDLLCDLLDV